MGGGGWKMQEKKNLRKKLEENLKFEKEMEFGKIFKIGNFQIKNLGKKLKI